MAPHGVGGRRVDPAASFGETAKSIGHLAPPPVYLSIPFRLINSAVRCAAAFDSDALISLGGGSGSDIHGAQFLGLSRGCSPGFEVCKLCGVVGIEGFTIYSSTRSGCASAPSIRMNQPLGARPVHVRCRRWRWGWRRNRVAVLRLPQQFSSSNSRRVEWASPSIRRSALDPNRQTATR
jgi:hypothetical protein